MSVSVQIKNLYVTRKLERKIKEKEVSKDEINKQLKFIGKKWSLTLNAFKRKGRIAMSSKDKNLTPVQQEYKNSNKNANRSDPS